MIIVFNASINIDICFSSGINVIDFDNVGVVNCGQLDISLN